jgi:hypothetical protein
LFSSQGCEDRLVTCSTSLLRVTQLVRMCGHLPRPSATRTDLTSRESRACCSGGSDPFTITPATPSTVSNVPAAAASIST